MASAQTGKYPYIPAKSWWALRRRFQQALPSNTSVSPEYLGSVLDMTPDTARKTVLAGLKLTGLVDEDGKVTDRGLRWRSDEEYSNVCREILEEVYPEDLIHAITGSGIDRDFLNRWFRNRTTLGEGRAKAAASFIELIAEADLSKENAKSQHTSAAVARRAPRASQNGGTTSRNQTGEALAKLPPPPTVSLGVAPSVHIDMHFHVSPEARPEQIDKIFESMARHLNLSESPNDK